MTTTKRLLHMIGNAHIDAVWLWPWQEGLQEIRATFASALARLEEYPELIFTCDSVAYLAWIAKVDPAMFDAIRLRVAEGRWQLVGGWWVEPDCNIPSGESFVRQALYGQRFLAEHFGTIATTGCNVDPFGHHAWLPQLLRKSGMNGYVFLRPQPHEKALPAERFWWASPDGSRVLAYRIPVAYCSPGEDLERFVERVLARTDPDEPELMVFYGVGNHGGGPTKANIDSIRRLNEKSDDLEFRCSSIDTYFARLRARGDGAIPTHTGELQHHSVGCYSAHSGIKAWNRRAENQLLAAEKLASVAAAVTDHPYPLAALSDAWKLVLFNQFHDTLGGTAIEPAYRDSRDQFGAACTVAAEVVNTAAQRLAARIDIPHVEGTAAVVVTNPLAWEVTAPVELELQGLPEGALAVHDAEGNLVPSQLTQPLATVGPGHRRLVIDAAVPGLGYRVYRVSVAATPAVTEGPANVLDNGLLRLEVDPHRGWFRRVELLEDGIELIGEGPGDHAVVVEDGSDTWSHDVVGYGEGVGRFECRSVRRVEDGPVRSVLRIESGYGRSSLIEDVILARGATHVEVRVTLDWHETQRLLKLRFPCRLERATATFAVPFGHVERAAEGGEEAAQGWVDVSGTDATGRPAGWSLLNDAKYGFDVQDAEIGMTAARSPVYAWHNPKKLDPAVSYHYLDQGEQEFRYGLVPHRGDWRAAGTVRLAEELNCPLVALPEHAHPGDLPATQGFCSAGGSSVVVSAVKVAEGGDAFVIRAYESAGRPAIDVIDVGFLGRRIEATFGPGEVKTFLVPRDPLRPVVETSLLEWTDEDVVALGGASAALDR